MPIQIEFSTEDSSRWTHRQGVYVRGAAFDGSSFLDSEQLTSLFAAAATQDEFRTILRRLNGFFAVVQVRDDSCRLAVDQVRSIPLFYGTKDGEASISDSCELVASTLGATGRCEVADAEFLHLGYVTGRETRVPEVRQCLAGEVVSIESDEEPLRCSDFKYSRFRHESPTTLDARELCREFEEVLEAVFGRLIDWARGRTILIPLSGGYDSRLIALFLRKLGYPKLAAFSYGKPGNEEARLSRCVAEALGIDWHFVPYSNEMWAKAYYSSDRLAYAEYNGALVAVPVYQDWPAVRQLVGQGRVPEDSVIVPGHSADLLAGSRSAAVSDLYSPGAVNQGLAVEACLAYHYTLWRDRFADDPARSRMIDRLRQQIAEITGDGAENNASVFETWDTENRQAKFIVNSVRAYEFFRKDWWLPFWDKQSMAFFARVPLELRVGKRWYDDVVNSLYRSVTGKEGPRTPVTLRQRVRSRLAKVDLLRRIVRAVRPARPIVLYHTDPMCWYGHIPEEQFSKIYAPGCNINSFLAGEILGEFVIDSAVGSTPRERLESN